MEYVLEKEKCCVCETVFDGVAEQPVDLDFSLPDYCPDIERILKCRICPSITSKNISGDRLDVDGTAVIKLYYLDSKKQAIRYCEHTSPFSCSFNIKNLSQDMTAVVKLRVDYLNCRALSPRRLDIHGAFSVCATVCSKSEQDYCRNIEGDDIQQKKHSETVSTLSGIGQQQFSVSEVLDIGQGKQSPETIIRSELTVNIQDSKAISDKLMLKGEVILSILYITDIETGSQDTMTFSIPISQVVDVQGISETSQSEVSVDVLSYDVALKSEYDENSTLVTLDARLCATVYAYDEMEIELIDDAYSTAYELDMSYKQTPLVRLASDIALSQSVKDEVKTGDSGITKIIDLWSDGINSITAYENGTLTVKGKINCCIFALDSDNIPFYVERALDFVITPEIPQGLESVNAHTNISLIMLNFRITGDNSVEIKADIRLKATIFETRVCKAVSAVSGNEERKREKDKTAALTLYYADEGENLWSIARLYCTSVEAIKLENELTDDVIQARGMILIPM